MKYQFAEFEIDISQQELRRRGEFVHIEPQVFDLIVHLVRNHDRIVSKDELIETIWHGRIISEAALSSRINAARRALGDNGNDQSLIRTQHKRGFRFVGDVRAIETLEAEGGKAMNNHGQLIGVSLNSERSQQAFLASDQTMTWLNGLPKTGRRRSSSHHEAHAQGLNDRGEVVGWSRIERPNHTSDLNRATLWKNAFENSRSVALSTVLSAASSVAEVLLRAKICNGISTAGRPGRALGPSGRSDPA